MRPQLSASSNAHCVDCTPNGSHQRIVVALALLSLTTAAILLWRVLLEHTGDALIAALLVGVALITFIAPAAKLLRS
ncbi:hypothetical protein EWE75_07465 [Sphingomonas populi]|uniref:Uncharacterized protein n=1 Tax=Sphingomonas populi TaxID=2484750 RepID=A0A4V2DDJ4_9SPHN|nr:hypothetical protein [Sphingomonas populi]RZF65198.1 hypothetical protein EWE75_07465 [Sphingomonas populi]